MNTSAFSHLLPYSYNGPWKFVIANEEGMQKWIQFFNTPYYNLLELSGKFCGFKTVKWVRVDLDSYKECDPSRFPDWLRVIFSILFVIPASAIAAGLGIVNQIKNRSVSLSKAILMKQILNETEADYFRTLYYRKPRTKVAEAEQIWMLEKESESDNFRTLCYRKSLTETAIAEQIGEQNIQNIPAEIIVSIFYYVLKNDLKHMTNVNLTCRQFYHLLQEKTLWRALAKPFGFELSLRPPSAFNKDRFKFIILQKRIRSDVENLKRVFDSSADFESMPLVQIPTGYRETIPKETEDAFFRVSLIAGTNGEIFENKNFGRFCTSSGTYGLFFKFEASSSNFGKSESYLVVFNIKNELTFYVKSCAAPLRINAFYAFVSDESNENSLRNFINGQQYCLKNIMGGVIEAVRLDKHFLNDDEMDVEKG